MRKYNLPSISLVFKLLLAALPVWNLKVVVFIPSFSALIEDKLIQSLLYGMGKLNGSGLLNPLLVPAGYEFENASVIFE